MQTILGSKGVIAKILSKKLTEYTPNIRQVSRNPQRVNEGDELVSANLLNLSEVMDAVAGSEIVYLSAGLKYNIKTWEQEWPIIIDNVLAACKTHGSKLVFFDNVYAYGRVNGYMTEETPYKPCSKKGELRVRMSNTLMEANAKGDVSALIARSADFYGPDSPLSFFNVMVLENLLKGKKAQYMMGTQFLHSFTYTPDAGIATAMLANQPENYGQIWHLPTAKPALTGKELIEIVANALEQTMVLGKGMLRLLGLFIPVVKESMEMLYQNDQDYLFDSSKAEKKLGMIPTSYKDGMQATVDWYKNQQKKG
jgi:nucleoside-diphosphate-sugar epimerase